jgi:DNA-directed RNA polymerase
MRFKDSIEQEVYLREATNAGSVELVYAGLDILGSTPWKINRSIFDVVVKVWNSGVRMGKLPPAVFDQPEPVLDPTKEADMEENRDHILKHRMWAQRRANNHSDRCSVNYKIEIARAVC